MRKRSLLIFAGAAVFFVNALAGVRAPLPADVPLAMTIHIGSVAAETYAEVYYAQDLGFFKKAGLNVDIQTFASGGQVTAGVASGALDIGGASTSSIAAAHVRDVPVFLVAPAAVYSDAAPTGELAVLKTSAVQDAKDLIGKTVAVTTLRDITQVAVQAFLDAHGGNSKQTNFIEIPPSEEVSVLQSHRVDAIFISEPFLTQGSSVLRYIGPAYSAISPRFMVTGWMANKAFIDAHPEAVDAFVNVMRQTAAWANANHAASAKILAKYSKLDPETVSRMNRVEYVPRLDASLIQPVIDKSAFYQTLPRAFPANGLFFIRAGS
jgi:NitT/TauT family transport system substrate-binding protein